MRRIVLALSFAALSVVGFPTPSAVAQDSKTATGTVTELSGSSVTVKVGMQDMKFSVDEKTTVEARGAGTRDRAAAATGAAGPKLIDLIKTGQAVEVTYTGMGASMRASRIRAVASASGGGGMLANAPSTSTSMGTVTGVMADSITITGSASGGASFTQSFTIDGDTKVVAMGAGTATAARGGKIPFTALVGKGDRVSVSYHTMGSMLHAAEIRVTAKGKG